MVINPRCMREVYGSRVYRAHTMFEMSNALPREPQRADLNTRRELISRPACLVFICRLGMCGFISRQSAFIAWHNAFYLFFVCVLNLLIWHTCTCCLCNCAIAHNGNFVVILDLVHNTATIVLLAYLSNLQHAAIANAMR